MNTLLLINLLVAAAVSATDSGIFHVISPNLAKSSRTTDGGNSSSIERTPLDSIVHARRETNGDRFRLGKVTPMKPTKRKSALRPRASPAPACAAVSNIEGHIQVNNANTGVLLGYLRKTFDSQNSYTYGTLANALTVKLPIGLQNNVLTEFTAVDGPDLAYPLVGAVGGSGGYNFNTGQIGYAYLTGAGHTAANSPPSSSAGHSLQALGYSGPAESTVWKVNCATLSVTAQWTNTDGSQPLTSFFYDSSVDFVGLIGDFSKFTAAFPSEGAILVTLQYMPLP